MNQISPPESVHALDLEALRLPNITFWSAWLDSELIGCGALKELSAKIGEIKSMRTSKNHRGKGVASKILKHIIKEAERRGYDCLNLETGSFPEFAPARAVYIKYELEYCLPFGEYVEDPNSVFMTRKLDRLTF